ncbi:type I-E CRISPR-associated endoribonuclease Cas2e [Streptomyces sp. NPDC051567]|uniref:type I-E CRISPR-associated endoribonuclease Cas2e n=1 Tax=Streptomyces sp. NPDC051567 TaxID=3365660 RepID=UPI00379D7F40
MYAWGPVVSAVPEGLRGHFTRRMVEASAGVFVGKTGRRVRDRLWEVLATRIGDVQVILTERAASEQGWAVRTAGRDRWHPVDFDGLILSARPKKQLNENSPSAR